jgi:O-antigen ligase
VRRLGTAPLASPRRLRALVVAAATASIVTAANASQGAYFSQSWGWVALAFLVPTTILVLLDRATLPGRFRLSFMVALGALAVWIALSTLWSISPAGSMREVERMVVYVGVALAIAFVARRGDEPAVVSGALVGCTLVSSYGLATRLFPDRFDTFADPELPYRLGEPIGYWNALGLLATMGVVLALGLAAHARRPMGAAGAGLMVPVLVATLYFTFSRGAWGALIVGLVAMLALDPRRLRLAWTALVLAPAAIATVAIASRQEALTHEDAVPAQWEHQGHRLALVLLVLAVGSGLLAMGAHAAARRVRVSRRTRRAFDLALGAIAIGAVTGALIAVGGPFAGASKLRDRFDRDPVVGADLNERLFSASGNGRSEQLRVSWDAGKERPVTGYGSGTFEYLWYERRPNELVVRDGHSLYAETFAELGVVGLALLGLGLVLPLVAALRARRARFVAAGAAAFVAWATACALDWHWEIVGVTMTALLAGGSCLIAADGRRHRLVAGPGRIVLAGVGVALSLFAVVSLVGNQALFAARDAVAREDWSAARTHAERARTLLPWSFEPDLVLGDAYAGLGDRGGALRAYRDAVATDGKNWVAWLRLAQVAAGRERARAYVRVHELNPREGALPGEDASAPG